MNTMKHMGQSLSAAVIAAAEVRTVRAARLRALGTTALLAGVLTVSLSGMAHATNNFDSIATETVKNTNTAADIVTYVCYIGGAVLAALGVVDLKKHVEQPSQNPLKNGLAKLGFGAMLIALPFITNSVLGTMGANTNSDVGFDKFGTQPTITP